MYNRRNLLKTGTAAVAAFAFTNLAGCSKQTGTAPAATGKAADLNKLYDQFMDEALDRSPEFVTSLGLDNGKRAAQKAKLSDHSLAQYARDKARNTDQLHRLEAVGREGLTGKDAVGYEVVHYNLSTTEAANQRYEYGGTGAGIPYIVNQFNGTYQNIPDFLDSQHTIENKADADAYLSRLEQFATALDQDNDVIKHDAGIGAVPPDFVIDRTIQLLKTMRAPEAGKTGLVGSIVRRTKEKGIAGDWEARASAIVAEKVYPAVERQTAVFEGMRQGAVHDAGVWRLPKGDQYYADSLIAWATTDMKPEEIHKIGLDVVSDHTRRIDELMRAQGLTQGTVGERFAQMYKDPKFAFPNTDAGREELLADLNKRVQQIRAMLPQVFGVVPNADLIIKRVPKEIEAAQAGGYYQSPSLDNKRPGMYYINLRDTAEQPKWALPTLTYHEGIPGHHLQLSIQQEADLPLIRRVSGFSAYSEGWALYAEQLADEMGLYANDPLGKIGQLHDAMFRGVRCVVDTGMHAMKWSREQAIKYYMDALGDPEKAATTEVERYCVWPGQACSYMLGKITILKLRDKAKAELGGRFDIHKFHDAILTCGGVPLAVLETVVNDYIAANKTA